MRACGLAKRTSLGDDLPVTLQWQCVEVDVQKDNWRLKQHLMDLRRAARRAACNLTTKDTLLTFPEVEQSLQVNETLLATPVVRGEQHHHLHRWAAGPWKCRTLHPMRRRAPPPKTAVRMVASC